jgi:hypothetical protein
VGLGLQALSIRIKVMCMIQKLKPAWMFFPFTVIFSALFLAKGQMPSMLAGALFSAIAGFRIRSELAPGRAFPIFMLFLFLLVLGIAPVKGYSAVIIATTLLLITLRILLLLLGEIQGNKASLNRAQVVFSVGLFAQFLIQMVLVMGAFRGQPSSLSGIAELLNLRVLLGSAAAFTPIAWPVLALVGASFVPALQTYSPWVLFGLSSLLMVYRIRKMS